MIQFTIPGAPVAKGRPRARIIQKRGQKPMPQIYTPEETRAEEARLREYVCLQHRALLPRRPLAGPLKLEIVFVLRPPQHLDKHRSKRWPHVGADVDNFVKLFSDAMNGIIYEDDSQVCAISAIKVYGSVARTEVRISQLSDADEAQHSLWGGIADGEDCRYCVALSASPAASGVHRVDCRAAKGGSGFEFTR